MGALGVYIGLPPRGTMVIWPGVGPGCQRLQPPASPPTAGARRLVGPADWLVAVHCSRVLSDGGLVILAWLHILIDIRPPWKSLGGYGFES